MKRIFTVAIIWICAFQLFAQDELAVAFGSASPMGDFSNATTGGGAEPGFVSLAMYQHRVQSSKFWLAGMLRFQSNGVDATEFATGLQNPVSGTNWKVISLLVGPVLKLNISERISIDPKIMVGYSLVRSPKLSMYDVVGAPIRVVESANANAFTTLLGVSLNFKASDKVGLLVGADFITADPKFHLTESFMHTSFEADQRIDTFCLMAGVSFKLR